MTKGKKKTWAELDHETRLERITALWNDGKSDKMIADELSATKGQIVGYRHTHLPNVTAATRGTKHSGATAKPRSKPPLVQPKAAQPKPAPPENIPEPSPPRRVQESRMTGQKSRVVVEPEGQPSAGFVGKMTSDWTKQCGHMGPDSKQCGFHFTIRRGNEKRCNLHAEEIK